MVSRPPDLAHPSLTQLFDKAVRPKRQPVVPQSLTHLDERSAGSGDSALQQALQLLLIAGPAVLTQSPQRIRRDPLLPGSDAVGMLAREEMSQFPDVLRALR